MKKKYYGEKPYVDRRDDNFYFSVEAKNLDTAKAEIIRLKCEKFKTELREVYDAWDFECGQEININMSYTEAKW